MYPNQYGAHYNAGPSISSELRNITGQIAGEIVNGVSRDPNLQPYNQFYATEVDRYFRDGNVFENILQEIATHAHGGQAVTTDLVAAILNEHVRRLIARASQQVQSQTQQPYGGGYGAGPAPSPSPYGAPQTFGGVGGGGGRSVFSRMTPNPQPQPSTFNRQPQMGFGFGQQTPNQTQPGTMSRFGQHNAVGRADVNNIPQQPVQQHTVPQQPAPQTQQPNHYPNGPVMKSAEKPPFPGPKPELNKKNFDNVKMTKRSKFSSDNAVGEVFMYKTEDDHGLHIYNLEMFPAENASLNDVLKKLRASSPILFDFEKLKDKDVTNVVMIDYEGAAVGHGNAQEAKELVSTCKDMVESDDWDIRDVLKTMESAEGSGAEFVREVFLQKLQDRINGSIIHKEGRNPKLSFDEFVTEDLMELKNTVIPGLEYMNEGGNYRSIMTRCFRETLLLVFDEKSHVVDPKTELHKYAPFRELPINYGKYTPADYGIEEVIQDSEILEGLIEKASEFTIFYIPEQFVVAVNASDIPELERVGEDATSASIEFTQTSALGAALKMSKPYPGRNILYGGTNNEWGFIRASHLYDDKEIIAFHD